MSEAYFIHIPAEYPCPQKLLALAEEFEAKSRGAISGGKGKIVIEFRSESNYSGFRQCASERGFLVFED